MDVHLHPFRKKVLSFRIVSFLLFDRRALLTLVLPLLFECLGWSLIEILFYDPHNVLLSVYFADIFQTALFLKHRPQNCQVDSADATNLTEPLIGVGVS